MTDERLTSHQSLWFNTRINLGKDGHLAVQLLMNTLFNEATIHLMVQTSHTRVTATTHHEIISDSKASTQDERMFFTTFVHPSLGPQKLWVTVDLVLETFHAGIETWAPPPTSNPRRG